MIVAGHREFKMQLYHHSLVIGSVLLLLPLLHAELPFPIFADEVSNCYYCPPGYKWSSYSEGANERCLLTDGSTKFAKCDKCPEGYYSDK